MEKSGNRMAPYCWIWHHSLIGEFRCARFTLELNIPVMAVPANPAKCMHAISDCRTALHEWHMHRSFQRPGRACHNKPIFLLERSSYRSLPSLPRHRTGRCEVRSAEGQGKISNLLQEQSPRLSTLTCKTESANCLEDARRRPPSTPWRPPYKETLAIIDFQFLLRLSSPFVSMLTPSGMM